MTTKKEIKMIEDLSEKQEAQLDAYYEKWLKIGLRAGETTDHDREAAEEAIFAIYAANDLKKPKIIWAKSPYAAIEKLYELGDKKIKQEITNEAGFGQHDANWLGFYDFFRNEVGLKEETEDLIHHMKLAEHCGWWWPYENVCMLSEIPIFISLNENGDLHNFNGAALKYSDGFELFHFNGVKVPQELAEMPAEKITKKTILEENNSDIRREIIRKIGIAKTTELLGSKTIDTFKTETGGEYELLMISYDDRSERPYLKMKDSSCGEVFILGSRPEIKKAKAGWEFLYGQKFEDVNLIWEA